MAKNEKPIQIQRVGLNFLKHYAVRLPLVGLYVAFISTAIIRNADPVNAGSWRRLATFRRHRAGD
jgi:hypothetical protein